ncbi:hypothetical protein RchiOBHm_Chr5g0026981 [Rosa chinensis]|uniref:Uncharacterized protein n=1 Tax=Rosa chinensis TaxID=74649 RepID=A0A2P6Q920_ROSCH|nr:hypothetical protein RchiOBHm_Chr5g0026981 [Rosa chinensis]
MNPILWHKLAAVSGMAAFGLGIYGADGFKPKNPAYKEKTFQTLPTFGNLRQLNLDIPSYQSKSEEVLANLSNGQPRTSLRS